MYPLYHHRPFDLYQKYRLHSLYQNPVSNASYMYPHSTRQFPNYIPQRPELGYSSTGAIFNLITNCPNKMIYVWLKNVPQGQPAEFWIKVNHLDATSIAGERAYGQVTGEYITVELENISQAICHREGIPTPGTESENTADRVIIACISGRGGVAGTGRGIVELRDTLRNELKQLGVKPDNIFRRSWNHNQDDNPFGAPWIEDLLSEIQRRSQNPSYLAIIGHSYGGWAACRLSRVTNREPDFIGLIDPVFGSTNTFTRGDIPRGKIVKNWYQNNSIFAGEPCTEFGKIPCRPATNGISCGYQNVPGAHENVNEHFLKDWNGNRIRVSCGIGPRRHLLTSHLNIDEDKWIHRQIRDQIYNDLSKLLGNRPTDWLISQ